MTCKTLALFESCERIFFLVLSTKYHGSSAQLLSIRCKRGDK